MTMRLTLDAQALRLLVDQQPEAFLEITQRAVEQVGEAVTRRLSKDRIEKRIEESILEHIGGRQVHYGSAGNLLRQKVADVIGKEFKNYVREQIVTSIKDEINTQIPILIQTAVNYVTGTMKLQVEQIAKAAIVERIDALLNLQAKP
jgi:hypothetical protein